MKGQKLIVLSTVVAALGGLLFGFDTAVISGTTGALQSYFDLSEAMLGFTVVTALIGTIVGSMYNSGVLAPGQSPGMLVVEGDLILDPFSYLSFEMAGPESGMYDFLSVSGTATLGGTLSLALLDDYVPDPGFSWQIMGFSSHTGVFTDYYGLSFGNGGYWDVAYGNQGVYLYAEQGPVDSTIPEPATIGLLGMGLAGIAIVRRRRRRSE